MIIKVEQTKQNNFEIKINNELKYFSSMNKIPGVTSYKKGKGTITNIDGSVCYTLLPSKDFSVFSGKIRKKYCIFNSLNQNCGVFYKLISDDFLKSKHMIIEYENYKLSCYNVSTGKTQNISIYDGENQIAEIVKSVQALENYYIFLLDEYTNLQAILSFFVSYLEYEEMYSDDTPGVVGYSYTYSKNNKFYNKNWIENNFNKEDVHLINEQIQKERKDTINSIKTQAKYIVSFIISCLLILLIVFGILYYIYYR